MVMKEGHDILSTQKSQTEVALNDELANVVIKNIIDEDGCKLIYGSCGNG